MRTFLAELGCLPVSAMIHVPHAQDVFSADGSVIEGVEQASWYGYFGRTFAQLQWWAQATKAHRDAQDPHQLIKDFKRTPLQRNAPISKGSKREDSSEHE